MIQSSGAGSSGRTDTIAERAPPTRQLRQERIKTPKGLELERNQDEEGESETEDMTDMAAMAPNAPRPIRTTGNPYRKGRTASMGTLQLEAKGTDTATNQQIKGLTKFVTSLLRAMEEQKQSLASQNETLTQQIEELRAERRAEMTEIKAEITEMRTEITELREIIQSQRHAIQATSSTSPSYAEVTRTPPESQASNLQSLSSMNTTPSNMTDTLYCTVDTSRVEEEDKSKAQPGAIRQTIEQELRKSEDHRSWRCVAVTKDPRNTARIRIICRNEAELQLVKEAAQRSAATGTRVLRDQLYPVKIDNVNRSAILDQDGAIRTEAMEALGKENGVSIAKMAWLSRKETEKAYGSMVVYVTRGSDAVRLLQGQYFHVAGESGYPSVYEPRTGPIQ
jgi:hypothetical protein